MLPDSREITETMFADNGDEEQCKAVEKHSKCDQIEIRIYILYKANISPQHLRLLQRINLS